MCGQPILPAPVGNSSTTNQTQEHTVFQANTTNRIALLKPQGNSKTKGEVILTLDKQTHELKISYVVSGLSANSKHADAIRTGSSSEPGGVIYSLKSISADLQGQAIGNLVIKSVKELPATGWNFVIYSDKSTPGKGHSVVACGDIGSSMK